MEEAHVCSFYDVLGDMMNGYMKARFCDDEAQKEKLTKEFTETILPRQLNILAKKLEDGNQWLVGDRVSFYHSKPFQDSCRSLCRKPSSTVYRHDSIIHLQLSSFACSEFVLQRIGEYNSWWI